MRVTGSDFVTWFMDFHMFLSFDNVRGNNVRYRIRIIESQGGGLKVLHNIQSGFRFWDIGLRIV